MAKFKHPLVLKFALVLMSASCFSLLLSSVDLTWWRIVLLNTGVGCLFTLGKEW
jgi:hypothetical protein